jgi:hypothetical protein
MLWIGTADIKDLYLDEGNEKKPFLALIAISKLLHTLLIIIQSKRTN